MKTLIKFYDSTHKSTFFSFHSPSRIIQELFDSKTLRIALLFNNKNKMLTNESTFFLYFSAQSSVSKYIVCWRIFDVFTCITSNQLISSFRIKKNFFLSIMFIEACKFVISENRKQKYASHRYCIPLNHQRRIYRRSSKIPVDFEPHYKIHTMDIWLKKTSLTNEQWSPHAVGIIFHGIKKKNEQIKMCWIFKSSRRKASWCFFLSRPNYVSNERTLIIIFWSKNCLQIQ